MRAFMMAMVALVVITVAANFGLRLVPSKAADVYISKPNVRL